MSPNIINKVKFSNEASYKYIRNFDFDDHIIDEKYIVECLNFPVMITAKKGYHFSDGYTSTSKKKGQKHLYQ